MDKEMHSADMEKRIVYADKETVVRRCILAMTR